MRLKQLVEERAVAIEERKAAEQKETELTLQLHTRIRKWYDDGKSLEQIQKETGMSLTLLGIILGRKRFEEGLGRDQADD
tara:strand:- start:892 stop:1131 length:240 start_codon:yes stop_codon:yes gene_type:complete